MPFSSSTSKIAALLHQHRLSAAAAIASTSALTSFTYAPNATSCSDKQVEINSNTCKNLEYSTSIETLDPSKKHRSTILASSNKLSTSLHTSFSEDSSKMNRKIIKSRIVDYVIIGNGSAGNSALQTIQELHPSAIIATIDPLTASIATSNKKLFHYATTAKKIFHDEQYIELQNGDIIQYRNSILLSTGARGAPVPTSHMEDEALERILELKSSSHNISETNQDGKQLPILSPAMVRQVALMAASQNAHITVLGSGVEALELVAAISNASSIKNKKKSNCTLMFGSSSPLSSNIPNYLKAALMKRLSQHGIDVHSRSLVRYISLTSPENNSLVPQLEIHVSKSYDTLDSQRIATDLIVVAPLIHGLSGTAVMPYSNVVEQSIEKNYRAWSNIISNPVLSCYSNDGRVVVNAELIAASGIYAAGSVARYPRSGSNAIVAGDGVADAALAGAIAARNMVKDYEKSLYRQKGSMMRMEKKLSGKKLPLFADETLPMLRTDLCSYDTSSNVDTKNVKTLNTKSYALEALGIHALFIGDCDSRRMTTHGFWWTNQADDIRKARMRQNGRIPENATTNEVNKGFQRRQTTLRKSLSNNKKVAKRAVYGTGIVYYLDWTGKICGIMTWGIPITNSKNDSELNKVLVDRIKLIIETNGEVSKSFVSEERKRDAKLQRWDENLENLLAVHHLAEESKHLLVLSQDQNVEETLSNTSSTSSIPKPLHRYVPSKSANVTNLGSLKRSKGNHSSNEHMFMNRVTLEMIGRKQEHRRPSLLHIYPMDRSFQNDSQSEKEEEFDERSRPPREDPLWLYQSEQHRSYAVKDVLKDLFLANIRRGQFADGSNAVTPPPMPQTFQNAANTVKSLFSDEVGEGEGTEEDEVGYDENFEKKEEFDSE